MSDTPSEGAINVEQAVGLLGAEPPEREEAQEAPQEAAEAPPEPEEASVEQPEPESPEAPEGEEIEGEPDAAAAEPEDGLDPPPFWTAEDKADFADLPRKQQEKILAYEAQRVTANNKALEVAAQARKAYEAEAAKAAQLIERVNDVAAKAEAHFSRPVEGLNDPDGNPMTWDEVNWNAWFQADPQTAAVYRSKFDFEQAELQRVKTVQQEAAQTAQQAALTAHVQQQAQVLSTVAPDLANDAAKRQAIGAYLAQAGYSQDRLLWAEAPDLVIAHKAMLWDQAQSKARNAATTGTVQPSTPPGAPRRQPAPAPSRQVRPTTATTAPPPQRAVDTASSRLRKSGRIDDAVALLNARGSG